MVAASLTLPDLNTLDQPALKALILAQYEKLISRETEIENLKLLILKLRRMQFGRKSEKLDHQIEQLELQLEDLESTQTESAPPQGEAQPETASAQPPRRKPPRHPLPEDLPRETQTHAPEQSACPVERYCSTHPYGHDRIPK
jgi:hypothetical protein